MEFFEPRDGAAMTAHDYRVIALGLNKEPEEPTNWLRDLEIILGVGAVTLLAVVVLEKIAF